MNSLHLPPLSLRARFVLGFGAVLLPFLLAAAMGMFYLLPRLIGPIEDIARELTEEMEPVIRLQTALLMASMPVNDYLVHADPAERARFAQARRRVEQVLAEAMPERYTLTEERASIESAHKEWGQALRLAEELLRLRHPVDDPAARAMHMRFDAHIDRAVSLLEQTHDFFHRVIDEDRAAARTARTRSVWITFGAFVLALVTSLFIAAALARSVLVGVDALRQGASRLARGELSHRVSVETGDELEQLADAFNAMAKELEKDRAILEELSTHDQLTGAWNRRRFNEILAQEMKRARRYDLPLSLIMFDIDYFKKVNDTYSHQAGDDLLAALSVYVSVHIRESDALARWGGEEFMLVAPNTDLEAARCLAENLRALIECGDFGKVGRITCSFGVAQFQTADTAENFIGRADAAMYRAKQEGRNRVCGDAKPKPFPGGAE